MKNLYSLTRRVFDLHVAKPSNLVRGVFKAMPFAGSKSVRVGQGIGCENGCICHISVKVSNDDIIQESYFSNAKLLIDSNKVPQRTSNGKLLVTQCHCSVANALGSIVTSEAIGKTVDQARNQMIFVPRAQDTAIINLLRNLKLSGESKQCVQLVESALICAIDNRRAPRIEGSRVSWMRSRKFDDGDNVDGDIDFREQYKYF